MSRLLLAFVAVLALGWAGVAAVSQSPAGDDLQALIANTLVNDPAADTTSADTQSTTTIALASGSKVIVAFTDSGSSIGGVGEMKKLTGWSRSTDGGATWTDMGALPAAPPLSNGAIFGDRGHPVMAFSQSTGRLFLSTRSPGRFGIMVFRSDDDGASFMPPIYGTVLPRPDSGCQFVGQHWMTVDNFSGPGQGNVYLIANEQSGASCDSGIFLTRSIDNGATFTRPTVPNPGSYVAPGDGIYTGSNAPGVLGLVVGPDHAVYVFYFVGGNAQFGPPSAIRMRRSTDQGASFGPEVTVTTLTSTYTNGGLALNQGFSTHSFPFAAVNPASGTVYVAYNNPTTAEGGDRGNIFLRQSSDGGATWSAPTQVNTDATTRDQFFPTISVTPDGQRIFLSWYDRRLDPNNALIDYFGRIGTITGSTISFGSNFRITDQSFPVAIGQDGSSLIPNDYMGNYNQSVADNSFFYVTWGDNRLSNTFHANQPDVRFAKIPVAGPPAPTLTSVSPTSGAGGTSVTLTGTAFSGSSVTFGGTAATNVTVVNSTTITAVTPAHAAGAVDVVVTNSDTQSATLASGFTYVNSAPTITSIGNQSINEDSSVSGLSFTVADADTAAGSLTVTASSSNTTLVAASGLVLGGSGGARTLAVTPAANQHGTATITLTVSDGSLTATTSFTLTVNAVNDAPTISDIPNTAVSEDGTASVAFTVADVDTDVGSLSISASTSNSTLLPSGGIVFGGSGGNRALSLTPAANQVGTTTVTVTVNDGIATASDSFELTVTSVNDAPTISSLSTQTGVAGRLVGPLSVTVGDVDSNVATLTLTATSGNSAVVPPSGLSVGGSGASRTVTAQTSNATGTAVITLTVSDGSLSASTSFDIVSTSAAPMNFTAETDGSLVMFSWSAPASGDVIVSAAVSSYRVEVGPSAGATTVTLDAGTSTTITVSTLAAGTWFARVRALDSTGTGAASNEVSFTLTGAPSRPRNFAAMVAGNLVTLTWEAPLAGAVDGYVIEAGTAAGLANLGVFPVGAATSFAAAAPDGTYFTRVRALNRAGPSTPSNEVSFSTGAGPATPGAPQNLQVTVVGSSIVIAWSPPVTGGPPTGYILEAGSAPGLSNLGTLPLASTTFAVAAVPAGTYFVRVRATNAAGAGPVSNEVSFSIGGGPVLPPGNPTNLSALVSGSGVLLTWSPPSSGGAPTSYTIQAGSVPGLSDLAAVAIGVTTTFAASGVPPGTYFVRVVATNSAGASGPSNEVTLVVP